MKVGDPMNEDTTVGATIRYYPYVKVTGCLSVCLCVFTKKWTAYWSGDGLYLI